MMKSRLPETDLAHGSQISDPVERIIANGLDKAGIKYCHGGPHPALDFYLPDLDLHIECKRASTPRVAEQMSRFDRVIAIQSLEAAQIFAGWLCGQSDNPRPTDPTTGG